MDLVLLHYKLEHDGGYCMYIGHFPQVSFNCWSDMEVASVPDLPSHQPLYLLSQMMPGTLTKWMLKTFLRSIQLFLLHTFFLLCAPFLISFILPVKRLLTLFQTKRNFLRSVVHLKVYVWDLGRVKVWYHLSSIWSLQAILHVSSSDGACAYVLRALSHSVSIKYEPFLLCICIHFAFGSLLLLTIPSAVSSLVWVLPLRF